MSEDILRHLIGGLLPALGHVDVFAQPGQPRPSVRGHPAHDLRRGEVLRVAADLPDPAVGLSPVLDRRFHEAREERPEPFVQTMPRRGVDVHRVEQRAPDVVLALLERAVADAHRAGVHVALHVGKDLLAEVLLPVDSVHDLQIVRALGDVRDETEEVLGLPIEPEGVQGPEGQGGVPDPREPVVPVPLSPGRLRQGGRRGSEQRAGPAEGEALQREGAALEVRPPGVVRERAARQPVLPVVSRPGQPSYASSTVVGAGCSLHDIATKR